LVEQGLTTVLAPVLTTSPSYLHISDPLQHIYSQGIFNPSFVIFDILALWRSALGVRVPGCQKLQMTA